MWARRIGLVGLILLGCGGDWIKFPPPPPLAVTGLDPAPGSVLASPPTAIVATFNLRVDSSTVNDTTFLLTGSGGDGWFDDGNEVVIVADAVSLTALNEATMDLTSASLPDDVYQVTLAGTKEAGTALSFDGTDDYLAAPQWLNGSGNKVTVEMWARTSEGGPLLLHRASWNDMFIWWNGTTPPLVRFGIPSYEASYQGADIMLGEWYHLAGTYDGGTVRLYVNGELKGTQSASITVNWDSGYYGSYVGADGYTGDAWGGFAGGVFDEVRIWNVTRTQTQLQENMYRTLTGNESGLRAYYRFDEGSGQTAQDSSGSGKHATLGANAGVDSADPSWTPSAVRIAGGVTSVSGGILDGEFSGAFPSGDGTAGGDFVATFMVAAGPVLVCSPATFLFEAEEGGPNPPPETLYISNPGFSPLDWQVSEGAAWLDLSPASDTCTTETDEVTVSVNVAGLAPGDYNATITASAPGAMYSPLTVPVTLLVTGLVAHWKLDEVSDFTAYDSVGTNNGNLVDGPAWQPTGGRVDGALRFDGLDDHVEVLDADELTPPQITIAYWVQPTDLGNGSQHIIAKRAAGNIGGYVVIGSDGNNDVAHWVYTDGWKAVVTTYTNAVWQHVAMTYDGSSLKVYMDGSFVDEASVSGALNNNAVSLYLGSNTPPSVQRFNGLLDDVRIYNCALTLEEIQALASMGG